MLVKLSNNPNSDGRPSRQDDSKIRPARCARSANAPSLRRPQNRPITCIPPSSTSGRSRECISGNRDQGRGLLVCANEPHLLCAHSLGAAEISFSQGGEW